MSVKFAVRKQSSDLKIATSFIGKNINNTLLSLNYINIIIIKRTKKAIIDPYNKSNEQLREELLYAVTKFAHWKVPHSRALDQPTTTDLAVIASF